MAVRAETAAEIRAGRVGPRGRRLRENIEAAPEMASPMPSEAAGDAVLPSVFAKGRRVVEAVSLAAPIGRGNGGVDRL